MTYEKVKEIIATTLGINASQINENTDLLHDLGADSLDMVEIVMSIEDEYGISVDNNVVESIKTLSDVVAYIEKKINK